MANGERTASLIEERERGKGSQDAHESDGEGRDGRGLGDGEPRPGVEKAGQRPVGVANVDIFASGLRLHRAKLGVGDGARQRQHAADDPGEIDQPCRADRLHHLRRHQENAAADDGADDDRAGVAHAQIARELGSGSVISRLGHVWRRHQVTETTDWNYTR